MSIQTSHVKGTNPNGLYFKAIHGDKSIQFWGPIATNFYEAAKLTKQYFHRGELRTIADGKTKIEKLKDILRSYHKTHGIYTTKVEKHIDLLDNGSILTGQQPIVFGGPGFIANKIACMLHIVDLLEEQDLQLAPVFFVGDYDGLQKELARQYFPNPISQNAIILDSEEYLPEDTNIAVHAAKLPPYEWLDKYLEMLEGHIQAFKKSVKGPQKKLLDERWFHIKTLLKSSFTSASTLSDWAIKIWGMITNIVEDLGIVFLPTSLPQIRELVAPEYHKFIEHRKTYTKVFKEAEEEIKALGHETTLPHRHEDYSPFFLECTRNSERITTTLKFEDGKVFAEGQCPTCKIPCSYDISTPEDLQKIATIIGPRVDTSQAIFQDLMNIRLRISGPGEIAYYAQAAPAVRSIGIETPLFVKYKRAFYNSTWIEKLGKLLASQNKASLHTSTLFELLRDRVQGDKINDPHAIHESEDKMRDFVKATYEGLCSGKNTMDVQKYLGWQFGQFTPEKFGQEVSWIWFDMALQTGIADYIPTYKRMYTKYSIPGGYYFINSML